MNIAIRVAALIDMDIQRFFENAALHWCGLTDDLADHEHDFRVYLQTLKVPNYVRRYAEYREDLLHSSGRKETPYVWDRYSLRPL